MAKKKGGYTSALEFILSREFFGMKLGLENISNLLKKMGNSQNEFPSIHIAGTNGKGSTAAYLDSILRQAGYKTGLFTSPHLVDYRERIKISGEQIGARFVTDFIGRYRSIISRRKITFFETCTALAFAYFAHNKVDIAVIETGLGGRLDATNTLTPLISIITDISYDHTNILGDTLTKIAYEKAGIIKKDVPVLLGMMKAEPKREIARICRERNAPIDYLGKNQFARNGRSFNFDYHNGDLNMRNLASSLPGGHQINNAALAIRAIDMLGSCGFRIDQRHIREGLSRTDWPGRFQIIKTRNRPLIILDVGHNPSGIKVMVDCFKELFPGRKADLVIGFVKAKDVARAVNYLQPITKRVEIARLNTPRSEEPEVIASYFRRKSSLCISNSVTRSAQKLIDLNGPDDIVIICGSHYGVGEFMAGQDRIL